MTVKLYGKKNFKGSCVGIWLDHSDLQDTSLNYRTSSAELTDSDDSALFFSEKGWRGTAMFRSGRADIADLGKSDAGGKKGFNDLRSLRVTPFRMKIKYHFMYIDGDLPGEHAGIGGLFTLAKQIDDMHQIVSDIWMPYLIEFERDPLTGNYNSPVYFNLTAEPNELRQLKDDPNFSFPSDTVHVVLVETVGAGPGGFSGFAGIGKLHEPVVAVEVLSTASLRLNARMIAHEIGHVFGLKHGSNSNQTRLMTQGGQITGNAADAVGLTISDAETVHENLGMVLSTSTVSANPLLRGA